ncbi:MAG: metalloregulator ArsR/SmtB family transcription factor [Pseudomonadota bacterium]
MSDCAVFAALADTNRAALVERLRHGPAPVAQLAEPLPISRPAVSQHLKVLAEAGLVTCVRQGNRRIYRLSAGSLAALKAYADALWEDALASYAHEAQNRAKELAMSLDPVVKIITVPLPPEEAFELFTNGLPTWWPVESHSLSAQDDATPKRVTIEDRECGLIEETKRDGTRHPWGTFTAWEPGRRVAIRWHVGRPEDEATFIDVRFEAQPNGTRVTLIHDGWAALGETAEKIRGGYYVGWDMVLGQRYMRACQGAMASAD